MRTRFDRLGDHELMSRLDALVRQDRTTTAELVAAIAEVDTRRLYAQAGYCSLRDFCVGRLGLSEDAAYKRITAARVAREYPAVIDMLADGQLHLTAVDLLSAHISSANAAELLELASGKSKSELVKLLASRFPRTETLPLVVAVATPVAIAMPVLPSLAPERVNVREPQSATSPSPQLRPAPRRGWVAPIAAQRYELRCMLDEETHALLERARALLSHAVPPGDLTEVVKRALASLVVQLEKRKYGAADGPRPARASGNPRHVPASVRRAVNVRDGGRCTFVAGDGRRCGSRIRLEFDHVVPIARGGASTVDNLRLRCRAHNQLAAEHLLGAGFMQARRAAAGERDG